MKLNKRQGFLAILAIFCLLCFLYQGVWIFSRTATAEIDAVNTHIYKKSEINWMECSYKVGDKIYYGSYLKDGYDAHKRYFEIRYLLFDPAISRANTFVGNWGPLSMVLVILVLITSIVFIRKDIVSDQAVFIVLAKMPFVTIENNKIADYDVHNIENKTPSQAEQALRTRLQTEISLAQTDDVPASVYKYNPNAVGIFIAYVFYCFWVFYTLFTSSLGISILVFLGAILVFVPLYIQNTNNPAFKAKIPDEGSLVFSSLGVDFKGDFYSIDDIDAVVVYLEAFQGFKYRERTTIGNASSRSNGDNNKISFRYKGEVIDLVFILDNLTDYWRFKNLMAAWSAKGVNVLLQKVFEDDFIIQESVFFT